LRRLELVSRVWLAIEVGKRGGASAATYEERLSVRCKATGDQGGIGLHRAVTGSVTSDRMKMIPLTCGPGMAVKRREERRARRPEASVGPARYATRERGWLVGFGPNEKRVAGWAKEGGEKACGPKQR
jgi:hypothetical protein